jgi:hypothetical protein
MIAALIVGVPLLLWLVHVKLGDFWPVLIFLAVAASMIWIGPVVPHSPVSCIANGRHCTQRQLDGQVPWALGLDFVLPGVLCVAYKERRGDKRGVTGTRPVFRRRRR